MSAIGLVKGGMAVLFIPLFFPTVTTFSPGIVNASIAFHKPAMRDELGLT